MALSAVLVGTVGTTSGTSATTGGGSTAATGSTFAIFVSSENGAGTPTVSDSKGNVYSAVGGIAIDGVGGNYQWYLAENGVGGASHTATFATGSNNFCTIHLFEVKSSGSALALLDLIASGTQTSNQPYNTVATGTLTTSADVLLCACGSNSASVTGDYFSSNTTIISSQPDSTNYWSSGVSTIVLSSNATFSPSFTRPAIADTGDGALYHIAFREFTPGLSTTNLTLHFDASVNYDLWKNNTAGALSTHPIDNEISNFWDDVIRLNVLGVSTGSTVYRTVTPLMLLPCLDFDGSSGYYNIQNNAASANKALSDVITNSAFTVLVAIYAEGITTNAANAWQNDCIFGDSSDFMGIHLKNNASPTVLFYNNDGSADSVSLSITTNASHVLMFRHEGGNIYGSVDGGAESSTASGNTSTMTGVPRLGHNSATFYNGRIGEIAVWNAALTGGTLSSAMSYFLFKWLGITSGIAVDQGALVMAGTGSSLRYQINMPDEL